MKDDPCEIQEPEPIHEEILFSFIDNPDLRKPSEDEEINHHFEEIPPPKQEVKEESGLHLLQPVL